MMQRVQKMKEQNQQDSDFDAASLSMESSNSEDNNESMFKWSHAAILLLVEKYRLQKNNIVSGKISQKKVWNNIASALFVKGYNVTEPQCLSKFHGMKRTYKSIKDHNSKSGNNLRTWPYMEVMESLLGERPIMSSPAIASSSSMCSNSRSNRESNLTNANICNNANSSNKNLSYSNCQKRKAQESTSNIAESILQSRKLAENNSDQRHKENMDFEKQMLKFMGKILDKL
ncbi:uncharacterized protein LOC105190416 isoform X1 [Harpegnathos saltator]|uniref:uncharacterized protein LOC105190416 isoform X1 n=2 Tax=Harpegnathos saltator TaxID=610380 RepID=UPI000DBEEE69|nr:uncharacterized protein LOC105190416 isoform X1 [Harpegnathos saltator]